MTRHFYAHSDWLLKPAQTGASYEQNGFLVCYSNKRRNFTNKRRSCSRQREEGDEFIDKTGENVFCLQLQKSLAFPFLAVYLAVMFIKKLNTELNECFLQNCFKYRNNLKLLINKCSCKSLTSVFKGYFVGKKIKCDGLSVRSVICIVSSFVCSIISLFYFTLKQLFTSVLVVVEHHFCAPLSRSLLFTPVSVASRGYL